MYTVVLVSFYAHARVDEKPAQDEVARLNVVLHQRAVFDGQTRAHLNADPPVERAENVALKLEGRLDLLPNFGGYIRGSDIR